MCYMHADWHGHKLALQLLQLLQLLQMLRVWVT